MKPSDIDTARELVDRRAALRTHMALLESRMFVQGGRKLSIAWEGDHAHNLRQAKLPIQTSGDAAAPCGEAILLLVRSELQRQIDDTTAKLRMLGVSDE